MIVPAADAARAVAYSPEDGRDISLINKQMLLNLMLSNYAEGTAQTYIAEYRCHR